MTVIQNFSSQSYIIQYSQMFKKPQLIKLSACKLQPLTLEVFDLEDNIGDDMFQTVKTPRHQSFKIKDAEGNKTQKLMLARKPMTNRERLPSLMKFQEALKENLLDLDLGFDIESPKVGESKKITERNNYVIKKKRAASISSKGKDTSIGSSDSSVEGISQTNEKNKNTTESSQTKKILERGKSYTKNVMPCRIVNSKKLPFDLNPRNLNKKRQNAQEWNLDISIIGKKDSQDMLVSQESYQNLCNYF